ncbi:hypothetical protein N2152v2_000284 [Parachlorella kessleri]
MAISKQDGKRPVRVATLLPSATEILWVVAGDYPDKCQLVGRSHECDWPELVKSLPVLTGAKNAFESSKQMDEAVRSTLASGESLYTLDITTLQELRPDVVITQSLCHVCSVNYCLVERLTAQMDPQPQLVDLNPQNLDDVLQDMQKVGDAVGLSREAAGKVQHLQDRIAAAVSTAGAAAAQRQAKGLPPPRVGFLEWTDPLFIGGHWTPQLIHMAGGEHPLNPPKDGGGAGKSFTVEPEQLLASDPDWLIICPCGFEIPQALREMRIMVEAPWWNQLRAVREGRVVIVDGDHMFNRPGPRLVEALEFLVGLLHDKGDVIPHDFPYEMWQQHPGEQL